MTKYIFTTLMTAGLLSMPVIAQDEELDIDSISLDDDSSLDDADSSADADSSLDDADSSADADSSLDDADSSADADSSLDDADSSADAGSSLDDADSSADADGSLDDSDGSADAAAETTTGSDKGVIADPDTTGYHYCNIGNKYVLVQSKLVGHVTPLSTVVVYVGWEQDRKGSWGKGETLAKHSRTITSFYIPIKVTGVSIGGGNLNLYGTDESGNKTIKAPFRQLDNTIEVKRPEL